MKDFIDRIAGKPNRYKMTKETDGSSEYVTMQLDDEPSKAGTQLNREAFMAVQGFRGADTTISKSGNVTTIIANFTDGGKSEITITKNSAAETVIVDKYTGNSGEVITKTVTITKGTGTTIKEVLS